MGGKSEKLDGYGLDLDMVVKRDHKDVSISQSREKLMCFCGVAD